MECRTFFLRCSNGRCSSTSESDFEFSLFSLLRGWFLDRHNLNVNASGWVNFWSPFWGTFSFVTTYISRRILLAIWNLGIPRQPRVFPRCWFQMTFCIFTPIYGVPRSNLTARVLFINGLKETTNKQVSYFFFGACNAIALPHPGHGAKLLGCLLPDLRCIYLCVLWSLVAGDV